MRHYPTKIAFARKEDVRNDTITNTPAGRIDTSHRYDLIEHDTKVIDLRTLDKPPNFKKMGFTTLNLQHNQLLQKELKKVKDTSILTSENKLQILKHLNMASFYTADGKERVTILHPVLDGLFLRQAGPNDLNITDINGETSMGSAKTAHVDNNVDGTPLKQYIRGWAPWLFAHTSPGHQNHISPLHILRLWIPLQQPVRPLVVMDGRTFHRSKEQVAFHLPTGDFLNRSNQGLSYLLSNSFSKQDVDDLSLVDVWHLLYSNQQKWYFHSGMNYSKAFVFSTLDGAHSSCSLPGEDLASTLFNHLNRITNTIKNIQRMNNMELNELYFETDKIIKDSQMKIKSINTTIDISFGIDKLLLAMSEFQMEMNQGKSKRNFTRLLPIIKESKNLLIRKSVEVTCIAMVTRVEWNVYDIGGFIIILLLLMKCITRYVSGKVHRKNQETIKKVKNVPTANNDTRKCKSKVKAKTLRKRATSKR
jgi:hypothetical protein